MRTGTEGYLTKWACVFGMFLLALASFIEPQLAKAQTATGTITGTVIDPKGLAVLDASVVVRNHDTGAESIYSTNAFGIYVAPYLPPGIYEVTTSKSGFATVGHQNVAVHVGDTLTIDIQLPL